MFRVLPASACALAAAAGTIVALRRGVAPTRVLATGGAGLAIAVWLFAAPAFEPVRAVAPRLAARLEALAPGVEVVFGSNLGLPSVPFHAGRGRATRTAGGEAELRALLADPTPRAFVVDERTLDRVRVEARRYATESISFFNFDRGRPATWWILGPAAAEREARGE